MQKWESLKWNAGQCLISGLLLHIVGSYKYIPTLCYNNIYAIEQRKHSQFD